MRSLLFSRYIENLKNFLDFKSRADRKDIWGMYTLNGIIDIIYFLTISDITTYSFSTNIGFKIIEFIILFFGVFFRLFSELASISCCVRRFHDLGKSGWWVLLLFIPIISWIMYMYLLCDIGMLQKNQYGEPKKNESLTGFVDYILIAIIPLVFIINFLQLLFLL